MPSRFSLFRIGAACCVAAACVALPAQAQSLPDDPLTELLRSQGLLGGRTGSEPTMPMIGPLNMSGLVMHAMGFLGTPYRLGGNSVDQGFDCSGFVQTAFKLSLGVLLPRRAAEQAHATQSIEKTELQPGDLVFFNTLGRAFSHVGIYIGEGRFIHSPRSGSEVRVENMAERYWQARFNGARRVESGASSATSTWLAR